MLLLVVNGLALIVPAALAWLGYLPVTHLVEGDRTLRIGFAPSITRDGIFWLLAVSNLRQLVPDEAGRALAGQPEA